jgi:signal transduction histidine kinase
MRRLIGVLRDPPGHSPQPALDDVAELLTTVRTAGLPVTMTTTGQPFPLPATARLTIYRIIPEALTNTLKPAPGATARVQLDYQPGRVDLEITDTGQVGLEITDTGQVGLEITDTGRPGAADRAPAGAQDTTPGTGPALGMPAAVPGGGHGIAGMRERAALFAGHVTAGPVPGGGWRIHTTLRPGPGPAEGELAPADGSTAVSAAAAETASPATIGETGALATAEGAGPLTAAEGA